MPRSRSTFTHSGRIDSTPATPTARDDVKVADPSGTVAQNVLIFLGSASIATICVLQRLEKLSLHDAFLINLGVLAVCGLIAALTTSGTLVAKRLIENRTQLAAFVAVVVVGVGMRTWGFSEFPPPNGQLLEEPQTGSVALQAIESDELDVVFPLPTLLAESGLRIFGHTLEALRLPFLMWGIFSVVVFFIACRFFFRTFVAAFIASGLFACSAFLAGSSRVAMETMSPITTTAIALAAVSYCCARPSGFSFFVAGFGIGLLFLEFVGFKLVAGMLLVFLAAFFSQQRTPEACNASGGNFAFVNLWDHRRRFLLLMATIVAIYLPIVVSGSERVTTAFLENIVRHREAVTEETEGRTLMAVLESQLPNARETLPFVFGGKEDAGHDVLPSSHGLIDEASGVVGVVALVFCLVTSKRNPARGFLVLTICAAVVLSGVMVVNPSRYRLVPIIPLYFLSIGVLVEGVLRRWPGRRRIVTWCCTAGLCVTVALNLHIFFGDAIHNPDVQLYFSDFKLVVAQQIAEVQRGSPDEQTVLVSNFDFLGVANDYSFLYDPDRVRVIPSIDALAELGEEDRPRARSLVAHDGFISRIEEIPNAAECRTDDFAGTVYDQHRLVVCTLN